MPYQYARSLAVSLWEKHWKADVPEWEPLPDLIGVLTQIDNMTCGLRRLAPTAEERLAKLEKLVRSVLGQLEEGFSVCEKCRHQEATKGLDVVYELRDALKL